MRLFSLLFEIFKIFKKGNIDVDFYLLFMKKKGKRRLNTLTSSNKNDIFERKIEISNAFDEIEPRISLFKFYENENVFNLTHFLIVVSHIACCSHLILPLILNLSVRPWHGLTSIGSLVNVCVHRCHDQTPSGSLVNVCVHRCHDQTSTGSLVNVCVHRCHDQTSTGSLVNVCVPHYHYHYWICFSMKTFQMFVLKYGKKLDCSNDI